MSEPEARAPTINRLECVFIKKVLIKSILRLKNCRFLHKKSRTVHMAQLYPSNISQKIYPPPVPPDSKSRHTMQILPATFHFHAFAVLLTQSKHELRLTTISVSENQEKNGSCGPEYTYIHTCDTPNTVHISMLFF